jgi:chemotaxis protein MotB
MKRKKEAPPPPGAPLWTATFADLATNMMCLFVLLFSMSTLDAQKFQAIREAFQNMGLNTSSGGETFLDASNSELIDILDAGISSMPDSGTSDSPFEDEEDLERYKKIEEELQQMERDFQLYIDQNNLLEQLEISRNSTSIEIIFKDNILFDKGKDNIKTVAIAILGSIADLLSEKYPASSIEIIGHTDNDPINSVRFPNNWFLSSARAIRVGEFFINEKNFAPERILAVGRGEFDPVAPNDAEINKSRNRRVEIKIRSSYVSGNEE